MTKMEKEILEQPKVLASLKGVNEVTIKNLVSDIKQRDIRMVYFAARGTSDHASIYASYLISTYVGVPTALALPSVVTAYDGKLCLKDALVIGVSQSGKAADVLAVMEKAKQCGALTVAVTNDLQSPMAQFGDYHLYCNAGLEESVAATKTFTSQMYVLAMLAAVWGDNEAMLAKLDEVPGAVEQLLSYIPHDIEKIIQRYRYMENGFVLSRTVYESRVPVLALVMKHGIEVETLRLRFQMPFTDQSGLIASRPHLLGDIILLRIKGIT